MNQNFTLSELQYSPGAFVLKILEIDEILSHDQLQRERRWRATTFEPVLMESPKKA